MHGHARILVAGDEGVDDVDEVWKEIYGSSPLSWGEAVAFMVIDPTSMWAYASRPEEFPE